MKNKLNPQIITFYSTHHALRAEKVLKKVAIKVEVITVPRHISSNCGIAFKFSPDKKEEIRKILEENNIEIHGFHNL